MIKLSVFDTFLDSVLVVDDKLNIEYVNDATSILLDIPQRKMKPGTSLSSIVTLDGFTPVLSMEATPYSEVKFTSSSGKTGKIQISLQPLNPDTLPMRWIVTIRDVSLEEILQTKYRAELEKKEALLRTLEIKVIERTKELHTANTQLTALINSLGQGFLIFNKDGICSNVYTKACEKILETNPAGKAIWDVLKIPSDKVQSYRDWCETLFQDLIPFQDLVALGSLTYPHSQGRHIEIEYYPMRNDDGEMNGVVLVATDKTNEFEANLSAERERQYVKVVLQLIRARQQFLVFTKEALDMIDQMRAVTKHSPKPDFNLLLRYIHTIKGGAATFGVDDVKSLAHQIEEWIQKYNASSAIDPKSFSNEFESKLLSLEQSQKTFFNTHKEIIGREFNDIERRNEIPVRQLLNFLKDLTAVKGTEKLQPVFIEQFVKEPVYNLVSHINGAVQALGGMLGKPMKPVEITGGDLRVLQSRYFELFSSFIHIFRNALDHGIESHKERVEQAKDSAGLIKIAISKTPDSKIKILISDDGRGIDPEKVRASMRKRGLMKEAELSDEEVIQHIFEAGVSTKNEVTELSGRGVGLDMVLFAAKELGGTARVSSKLKKGTTFEITVPELNEP